MLIAFLPVHVHMLANSTLYPEVPVLLPWLRFPMQAVPLLWTGYTLAGAARPRTSASAVV